jgi:hypothetical protein
MFGHPRDQPVCNRLRCDFALGRVLDHDVCARPFIAVSVKRDVSSVLLLNNLEFELGVNAEA